MPNGMALDVHVAATACAVPGSAGANGGLRTIVMGLDQHRAQITAEWLDTATGEIGRARVAPGDRAGVRRFLNRFEGHELDVVPQHLVNAADGCLVADPAVASAGVVVLEPVWQRRPSGREAGQLEGGTPAVDTVVRRNRLRGNRDGVRVQTTARRTVLRGNRARRSGDDGIDVDSPSTTLIGNHAIRNGDLGIEAVRGVTDGGGNRASGNGNPLECRTFSARSR